MMEAQYTTKTHFESIVKKLLAIELLKQWYDFVCRFSVKNTSN